MKEYKITLIPGDGIGPEVTNAARMCVDAAADAYGFGIKWERVLAGENAQKKFKTLLPENTINSIKKNKVALKGPITTPIASGFRSVNVELRQKFELFANVRPAKLYPGVKSRYSKIDLLVLRENTEDLYAGIEFDVGKKDTKELMKFVKERTGKRIREDSAIGLKPISRYASKRIAKYAFEYAKSHNKKKVTAVHKANIMKYTDGLFLESAREVAKGFRDIQLEEMIVDNMCEHLVTDPAMYQVIVCQNLYGDIISDLCSGLAGSIGLAPSANIGDKFAIFEPVHGSAPKHAGKNDVNPSACILSSCMMLEHIGEKKAAAGLEKAVLSVIKEGKSVTYDLKPRKAVSTSEMAEAVAQKLK